MVKYLIRTQNGGIILAQLETQIFSSSRGGMAMTARFLNTFPISIMDLSYATGWNAVAGVVTVANIWPETFVLRAQESMGERKQPKQSLSREARPPVLWSRSRGHGLDVG